MSRPQRRRGNAKNASSSAAHMYLSGTGESFVGLTPEMNIFEMGASSAENVVQVQDESRIIFRKLIKKDSSTREKGLREMLAFLEENPDSVNSCYEHFYGIIDRLATDGSATVRLLSMKVVSYFINFLGKAASKGLNKVVPFIILSMTDASNSVCAAADSVLKSNFSIEKQKQIWAIFGPMAIDTATKIVMGNHEICVPAKYDAEESEEQRRQRLECQGLSCIRKLCMNGTLTEMTEELKKLYTNGEFIKKTLASDKHSVQVGLIKVCMMFPDHQDVLINSALAQWCLSSLDSKVDTICDVSWACLISILSYDPTFEKLNLNKTIIPRILNAVRKKNEHWRTMGRHLLPCIAQLCNEKISNNIDLKCLLTCLLESFAEKLPFNPSCSIQAVESWSSAFSENVKYLLFNSETNEIVKNYITDIVLNVIDSVQKLEKNYQVQDNMVLLLDWLFEKKMIKEEEERRIVDHIQDIYSKLEADSFLERILSSAKHPQFCRLHSKLFCKDYCNSFPFFAVPSLLKAEDNYFKTVVQGIPDTSFIMPTSRWSQEEAQGLAELISKIVDMDLMNHSNIHLEINNNNFGRELLLQTENNRILWDIGFLGVPADIIRSMIESWKKDGDGRRVANALGIIKKYNFNLEIDIVTENLKYLVALMETSVIDENDRGILCAKALNLLLFGEEIPQESDFKTIGGNLDITNIDRETFIQYFPQQMDIKSVIEISKRIDRLFTFLNESQRVAVTQKFYYLAVDVENILKDFAYLTQDALFDCSDALFDNTLMLQDNCKFLNFEESSCRIEKYIIFTLFNLSSSNCTPFAHAIAVLLKIILKYTKQRFPFNEINEEVELMVEDISMKMSHEIAKSVFESCDKNNLANSLLNLCLKSFQTEVDFDDASEIFAMYHKNSNVEFLRYVFERYSEEGLPLDFIRDGNHSVENLQLIYLFLYSLDRSADDLLRRDDREFVDFLLCGLVMIFDNVVEAASNNEEVLFENGFYSIFASFCCTIYGKLSLYSKKCLEITPLVDEWRNFYVPTLLQSIYRFVSFIKLESPPTVLVRALYFAVTHCELSYEIPKCGKTQFVPELDSFSYDPEEQFMIEHVFGFMGSDEPFIQLIGLRMSKLCMVEMLERENQGCLNAIKSADESTAPLPEEDTKIRIPVIVEKMLGEFGNTNKWSVPMLFDVCLPDFELSKMKTNDEGRMMYIQAIDGIIKTCLPALFVKQPEYIPKNLEREYFTKPEITPSPEFFDKYAANLLYNVLVNIPAAVRLWYKALPANIGNRIHSLIEKRISRYLIERELGNVKCMKNSKSDNELKIRTIPVSGEVVAEYTVDESTMKLTIGMPSDWPLSVPNIQLDKAIVKSDRAKKWLLQLTAYLFHQNGSTVDGIKMWKKNVDRDVEGAEACCICMMTIHSSTHQLPKVKCKQCKNKFHANCLYKWFESSNQSTCPLCRAHFT